MNVRHILEVVRDRWIVVAGTLVLGTLLAYSARHLVPTTYDGTSKVLIVNENTGGDPSVNSLDLPALATSTVVLGRVHDSVSGAPVVAALKENVKARVPLHSSIMEIGFRDPNPVLADAIPNAIADELTHYYREISTHRYNENERYLDAAVATQLQRLDALDRQLQDVTARDAFVGSDKAIDNLTTRLDDLETQFSTASATLVSDQAQFNVANNPPAVLKGVIEHEILADDPVYQNMRNTDARDAATLADDRSAYTARYPGLPGEVAKVDSESAQLRARRSHALTSPDAYSPTQAASIEDAQKAAAVLAGDRAKVNALNGLIGDTRRRLADLPHTGADVAVLRMQRDAAQTEYSALSTRRAAAVADRAEASSLGTVVVIDRAVRADAQVGGGNGRFVVIVSILLLALALGSAYLVDALDPRLRRADQVETLYGQPLITTLKKV
jgi:uncharacterized protein involved in exopolysaccharide biosynthesis